MPTGWCICLNRILVPKEATRILKWQRTRWNYLLEVLLCPLLTPAPIKVPHLAKMPANKPASNAVAKPGSKLADRSMMVLLSVDAKGDHLYFGPDFWQLEESSHPFSLKLNLHFSTSPTLLVIIVGILPGVTAQAPGWMKVCRLSNCWPAILYPFLSFNFRCDIAPRWVPPYHP